MRNRLAPCCRSNSHCSRRRNSTRIINPHISYSTTIFAFQMRIKPPLCVMPKNQTDKLTAEFKKNLKAILSERANTINPKKLSIAAGLGETAVRDILKNRSASPKLETIEKLAKALRIPIYRLIPSMIDHSYNQLGELEEEIQLLKEASGLAYKSLDELRSIVKSHS